MPELERKIKVALDEDRILVLGCQVLVAITFRTAFELRFAGLRFIDQLLGLAGLILLLLVLGLLLVPAARHRLIDGGRPTRQLLSFITRIVRWALFPFALALGIGTYLATRVLLPPRAAAAIGAAVALAGWILWHAPGVVHRRRRRRRSRPAPAERSEMQQDELQPVDPQKELEERINFAMTEVRVVLPGAQALLGFQAAIMFTEAFGRLPDPPKYAHLASLLLSILTVVLLMTPAAYHRVAEDGGFSRRLHRIVSRLLITAMATLGLGMSVELYVVVAKVTRRQAASLVVAAGMLLVFYGMWFGYALRARRRRRGERRAQIPPSASWEPTA